MLRVNVSQPSLRHMGGLPHNIHGHQDEPD
jgi:hypothetical protein